MQKNYQTKISYEIWNEEVEDFDLESKSHSGGKRVNWTMIPRVKRFKDDFIHALKNGKSDVYSVVPESTYTVMHEWVHYLSLDPKSFQTILNGLILVEMRDVKLFLLSNPRW